MLGPLVLTGSGTAGVVALLLLSAAASTAAVASIAATTSVVSTTTAAPLPPDCCYFRNRVAETWLSLVEVDSRRGCCDGCAAAGIRGEDVVCFLQNFVKIVFGQLVSGDSGADGSGEMALPQGHHYGGTALTV